MVATSKVWAKSENAKSAWKRAAARIESIHKSYTACLAGPTARGERVTGFRGRAGQKSCIEGSAPESRGHCVDLGHVARDRDLGDEHMPGAFQHLLLTEGERLIDMDLQKSFENRGGIEQVAALHAVGILLCSGSSNRN